MMRNLRQRLKSQSQFVQSQDSVPGSLATGPVLCQARCFSYFLQIFCFNLQWWSLAQELKHSVHFFPMVYNHPEVIFTFFPLLF